MSNTVTKPRPQRREARASLNFLIPRTVCFLHFSNPHSRQILTRLFTSDHPLKLIYNQSCSELDVKISPTRLAPLSGLEMGMILLIAPSQTSNALPFCQPNFQKSTIEHVGDMFKGKTDSAPTVQPNVCFLSPSLILQYLHSIERDIHDLTRRRLPLQNENENAPLVLFYELSHSFSTHLLTINVPGWPVEIDHVY